MIWLLRLLLVTMFILPQVAAAAELLSVTPSSRPVAILSPTAVVPPAPESLSESARNDLLQKLAGDETGAPTESGHFVLSARTPYIADKGYLRLTLPQTFHPESPIVFDPQFPFTTSLNLKVEQGAVYLVDFLVRAMGAGSYTVETAGGTQGMDDAEGSLERVTVALKAQGSGWVPVRLKREGTKFSLYAVEVTEARH